LNIILSLLPISEVVAQYLPNISARLAHNIQYHRSVASPLAMALAAIAALPRHSALLPPIYFMLHFQDITACSHLPQRLYG